MPFKSSAQRKFLFRNKPAIARKLSKYGSHRRKPSRKSMAQALARKAGSY